MSQIREEIAGQVRKRQTAMREILGSLQEAGEDDPCYEQLLTDLETAGQQLLDFEASIPAQIEAPHRRRSDMALKWSTSAHVAGAVVLGLLPLTGWIGWGWTVLAVVQLLAGGMCALLGEPEKDTHRRLRFTAAALTAVTVLVPLCVFDVLSNWFWPAVVLGWLIALGTVNGTSTATAAAAGKKVPA